MNSWKCRLPRNTRSRTTSSVHRSPKTSSEKSMGQPEHVRPPLLMSGPLPATLLLAKCKLTVYDDLHFTSQRGNYMAVIRTQAQGRGGTADASRILFGALAYILPTFPLGYIWHLVVFKPYYDGLDVYRDDVIIPFGLIAMLIQGVAWAFIYSRMFAGESVLRGGARFFALAAPLAWSFFVLAVAAKHRMASVSGFVLIETAFTLVQYAIVSPLMALAFAARADDPHAA